MLTIRRAAATDQTEILRLWHEGWHDAHATLVPPEVLAFRTPDYFGAWLSEAPDAFYVAVDGELQGFVSILDTEIVKLYVGRDTRGRGLAHSLLTFAERKLSESGVLEAVLFCTAGNSRAEKFYQREGWMLARTSDDFLWVPEGSAARFSIKTHRFQKTLMPSA